MDSAIQTNLVQESLCQSMALRQSRSLFRTLVRNGEPNVSVTHLALCFDRRSSCRILTDCDGLFLLPPVLKMRILYVSNSTEVVVFGE